MNLKSSGGLSSLSMQSFFLLIVTYQRQWREKQAEDIQARDEASKAQRQQTIAKAEHAIDQFYEEYTAKKERNIRENKSVEPWQPS